MSGIFGLDLPAEKLKIEIAGHSAPYDMSVLVPPFGRCAMEKLGAAFEKASEGILDTTFMRYFGAGRRFMLQGALAAEDGRPATAMFRLIRSGRERDIKSEHVEAALLEVYHRIADFDDFTFTTATTDKARAVVWESVRRFCSLLTSARYLPTFAVSAVIPVAHGTRTLVFADLARNAGRLAPCRTWVEAEEQALKENIELLQLLRDKL